MTTFTGFTAFFKDTANSRTALHALAEAVPQLKLLTGDHTADLSRFESAMKTSSFKEVAAKFQMFTPSEQTMPADVPAEYQAVALETKTLKGEQVTRLYFPVVGDDAESVRAMAVVDLDVLAQALFGADLLMTKTRTAATPTKYMPAHNETWFCPMQQGAPAFKLRP